MPYRMPAKVGERVALAPHLDLWLAGVRYGVVAEVRVDEENGKHYLVDYGYPDVADRYTWCRTEDLLGVPS